MTLKEERPCLRLLTRKEGFENYTKANKFSRVFGRFANFDLTPFPTGHMFKHELSWISWKPEGRFPIQDSI